MVRRPQESSRINIREPVNHLLIADAKMPIATKKLFYQKIVEELHVRGGKSDCRIDSFMKSTAVSHLFKRLRKPAAQIAGEILEHLSKVAILELQHVDIHEQPKVVMLVDHLLHQAGEPLQIIGVQRIVYLI